MGFSTEELIERYLPMSEQSFLLLLSLTEPRHGYGIMQMVLEQSAAGFRSAPRRYIPSFIKWSRMA